MDHDIWLQRLQINSTDRDQAIGELRNYLVRGLTRALLHRYGGKIQIEDVVQVALLKILDSLHAFQARSRFETWAMAIAIRVGISELRRNYYRDISLELAKNDGEIRLDLGDTSRPVGRDWDGDETDRHRIMILLQEFIDSSLSTKQRIAIRGVLDGLPIEEIARRVNSNRNAVYKLVHDARLRLRKEFEQRGITAEDVLVLIT